MKIYILSTKIPHEGQVIHGVYSTEEKAQEAMKKLGPRLLGEYSIGEYEVDSL